MEGHTPHYVQQPKSSSNRSFGFVFSAFFLIVALLPLLHGLSVILWAAGVSLTFAVIALVIPVILTPLNRVWTKVGLLLHRFVSPIALGILFFGVFTPTGFFMRLFGKGPLRLTLDKNVNTYWIARMPAGPSSESFTNQF